MRKMKKAVSCGLVLALSAGCFTACVEEVGVTERDDTSYLYVNTRDAGYGDGYLKALETAFEEAYADVSFAEGKTGVDVVVGTDASLSGAQYLTNVATSTYNISVVEGMYYFDYLAKDYLYDLSKIVKEDLADGTGTIESKLFDDQKVSLTASEGKYYALPVFAGLSGLTYDADLFEDNYLYFADEGGLKPFATSSYTGKAYTGRGFDGTGTAKRSPGPDGKYDTYDDGLPSSYEEFFYLLDTMVEMSITPLVWTGNSQHYTNYLFEALLSANSTKTEFLSNFTFDSGDDTVEIITSFNSDGTPNVENVKITSDNGYLVSQQSTRYQALKFMYQLFNTNDKYYDSRCKSSALSNTQAQKVYEESSLDPLSQDIAMMIEGGYWYNEASSELKESVNKYGDAAKNRNFRYMPLPAIETGTVNKDGGSSITLSDAFNIYAVINNNIKNDAEKVKLAETFMKFMYEDASLQTITTTTGVPVAVDYELTAEQYEGMDNYQQSLWDIYDFSKDNGSYVTPMSANSIFMNNTDKFGFKTTTKFFTSYIDGIEYSFTTTAFWSGDATARDYFEGMKISANDWTKTYNK